MSDPTHPVPLPTMDHHEDEEDMLDVDDVGEEIINEDEDAHMEEDDDEVAGGDGGEETLEEIQLQNDSIAHFDAHKDSIFCIAQHPIHPNIVATGGGDDVAYVLEATPQSTSVAGTERASLSPIFKATGHTDSVNAIAFTKPNGQYLLTAGLDGDLRAYADTSADHSAKSWSFLAHAQEVQEINFLTPCPHPDYPNTIALGASDGSVWVYNVNHEDIASPLTIVQAFYLHTGPCTAGAWTPDGTLLATVSEDGSFYVWDVFGAAAAAGIASASGQQAVVGLTAQDERFRVDGGLYSVAVAPNGAFVSIGGAEGQIRIVGLPRLGASAPSGSAGGSKGSAGAKGKGGGGRLAGGAKGAAADAGASAGQAGQLLASLAAQGDSVETISFAAPPLTLMATGSVDGSVALFDTARRFAVRRKIEDAHEGEAVIKVEFVQEQGNTHVLTTCGNDGVVRRWDTRGGTAAVAHGYMGEWRGHRGGGEGGGVMGFVQGAESGNDGRIVVTAGDDGVALVFDMSNPSV